jgi:hypothetical protein
MLTRRFVPTREYPSPAQLKQRRSLVWQCALDAAKRVRVVGESYIVKLVISVREATPMLRPI